MSAQSRLVFLKLCLDQFGVGTRVRTLQQRKAVQKAVWLSQTAGIELGYGFGWYIYGPYSPALTADYFALADGLSANPSAYNEWELDPDLKRRLASLRRKLRKPDGVELSKPSWLELVASLGYLMTVRGFQASKARVFLKREKPKLAPFMAQALSALKSAALVGGPAAA